MTNPSEENEYMSKEEWKEWDRKQIGHCQRGARYMVPPMIAYFAPKLANSYIARELNSRVYRKCRRSWPDHDLPQIGNATEIYEAFREAERVMEKKRQQQWWKGISAELRKILKAEGVEIEPREFLNLLKKTKHVWSKIKL